MEIANEKLFYCASYEKSKDKIGVSFSNELKYTTIYSTLWILMYVVFFRFQLIYTTLVRDIGI